MTSAACKPILKMISDHMGMYAITAINRKAVEEAFVQKMIQQFLDEGELADVARKKAEDRRENAKQTRRWKEADDEVMNAMEFVFDEVDRLVKCERKELPWIKKR